MSEAESTKIVIYSMNYAERLLTEIPYVPYSGERSLCHIDDIFRADQHVVVVTPMPIDPYVLDYHYRDLYQLDAEQERSVRKRLTLLHPKSAERRPLDSLVLDDGELMDRLRCEAGNGDVTIVNFAASSQLEQLATRLNARLEEDQYQLASRWGGKSGGKELLLRSGIPVARGGAELLTDEKSAAAAVHRLATEEPPARQVMVKLNDPSWAGAIGNVLVDGERFRRTGNLLEAVDVIRQPWPLFLQEIAKDGVIVEEYVPDVVSSPSGVGHVAADGTVRVLATHDQILSSSGQYWGCRFPAARKWDDTIADAVDRVGETLAELGMRGTFGIDFVETARGELIAIEVNLRKVGPSHVISYVESLVGSSLRDGKPVHYVNRRVLRPDVLLGTRPEVVVDRLRAEGLLFDHRTNTGVVLHMLGALTSCGYVEVTSVAPSDETADAVSEAAQAVILAGQN